MKVVYYAFDGKDFDDESECQEYELELMRQNLGAEVIYYNGKFDPRVIHNIFSTHPPVLWDTMIAAQLSNENKTAKLKNLYRWAMDEY